MLSFMKIKSSRNGEITLLTTDIGKSYPSNKIFRSQVCLFTLFWIAENFRIYSTLTQPYGPIHNIMVLLNRSSHTLNAKLEMSKKNGLGRFQ